MLGLIQQGMTTQLLPALGNALVKTKASSSQKVELLKEASALTVLTQAHQHQTQQKSCPSVLQIKELWAVPC